MIAPCPKEGQGVNRWYLSAAGSLLNSGASEAEARIYLHKNTTRTDKRKADTEIERALRKAYDTSSHDTSNQRRDSWPKVNESLYQQIVANGGGVSNLLALSPVKGAAAQDVMHILFPANPLLWCARKLSKPEIADTKPLSAWLPIADKLQFIVPSPMISAQIQPGLVSKRCLANVGIRKYLIIESDHGTADQQANILLHLARYLPFCIALSSGGKSIHGWFLSSDESKTRRFMEYAVSLKADPATFVKCQPVRFPGGLRDSGERQSILFFNPSALKGGAK